MRRSSIGVLLLLSSACSTWTPVPITSPQVQEAPPGTHFRVTLRSGITRTLTQLRVRNDSVLGLGKESGRWQEVGFTVADITSISEPGSTVRPVLHLISGVAFFGVLIVGGAALACC